MGSAIEHRKPEERYCIHKKSVSVDGKYGRLYCVYAENDELVAMGRGLGSKGPVIVRFGEDLEAPDFLMKMRKSFVFSGKVDVFDAEGQCVGAVGRNGEIFDGEDTLIGRFVSKSSWKDVLGEGMVDLGAQVLLGADSSSGEGNAADQFVLVVDKRPVGTFCRKRLGFYPDPLKVSEPGIVGKLLRTALPKGFFERKPPMGWFLDLCEASGLGDRRPLLCCAIMYLEIRSWAGGS